MIIPPFFFMLKVENFVFCLFLEMGAASLTTRRAALQCAALSTLCDEAGDKWRFCKEQKISQIS